MSVKLIHNESVAPSIDQVKLTHKQKFTGDITKNIMTFDREEDMIVMCLSLFVHDYVHDYNLGTMHARVIKGNIKRKNPDEPSLFESLGITIGNTIFKIMAYPVGGYREVTMYNDEQFEDEPSSVRDTRKSNFYTYLNKNEERIDGIHIGGLTKIKTQENNETIKDNLFIPLSNDIVNKYPTTDTKLISITNNQKPNIEEIVYDNPIIKDIVYKKPDPEKPDIEKPDIEKPDIEKLDIEKPDIEKPDIEKPDIEKSDIEKPDIEEDIVKEDTHIKSITFSDLKDSLLIPSVIKDLNIEQIVNLFERNADFLDFHSSLNIYIVTYLGYDINKEEEFINDDIEDKNIIINQAIRASLNYIINDFNNNSNSIDINFFGDIFRLLLDSYNIINKKNDKNPFDVLNSSEMLYQFILFYVSYISVENYDKFSELINQTGGDGTDDEGEGSEIDITEDAKSVSGEESSSPVLTNQKEYIEIPEYVFITHNNLLTTITRGMFIKLGIWKKIFFPEVDIRTINPDSYIFGFEELNLITYDKLIEIYPISPETGGHRNNELLILEILILKRLLVEMSPSKTLTFGAKIDDDLKNYMDTFYFDYFIKNNEISYKPEEILDPITTNNPNIYDESITASDEKALEDMFEMCEEGCDEYGQDFSAGSDLIMDGGGRQGSRDKIRKRKEKRERLAQEEESRVLDEKDKEIIANNKQDISVVPEITEDVPKDINIDIIEQSKPPSMPILFNKLQKMYQNNIYTIKQLKNSKIIPIEEDGNSITNIFDLLQLNETLMHKKGSTINIPAPKYKFVINNASNVGSNINGSKMFIPRKFLTDIEQIINNIKTNIFDGETLNEEKLTSYTQTLETTLDELKNNLKTEFEDEIKILNTKKRGKLINIREYNTLLKKKYDQKVFERTKIIPLENELLLLEALKEKPEFYNDFVNIENYTRWFRDSQPIFGLYRTLQRGIFCPTSSMMDAMDNCSLKYNTTEPKEVGTSYSEILYNGPDGKQMSFGGVVLNYNETVQGKQQLISKIYYTLVCNDPINGQENDTVTISTLPIKVSESNDLKARVAYQGVINRIKYLYDNPIPDETTDVLEIVPTKRSNKKDARLKVIKNMWHNLQYQYNRNNFNGLLSATALKTMGDYLQECQACFKWGGYISSTGEFPTIVSNMLVDENIQDKLIYRSVSKGGSIIPYNNKGDALRLGIQGDRPSGFRSIYMLLNGEGAVNDQAMTGYMFTSSTQNPSRTLLVSRNSNNMREPNLEGLKGNVIYVTRELQVPDKDNLLRSLEFLNIKTKQRKIDGVYVIPEISDTTIKGSQEITGDELLKNPMTKIQPFKNSAYQEWYNYETEFTPEETLIEIEFDETDEERERRLRRTKSQQTKGLAPEKKKITKEQIKDAKILINSLRHDLTEKQKTQTKPIIPLEILDTLRETIIRENGVSEEIFNLIHDEAEELDRAIKEFEAEEAEKERLRLEKEAYEKSPEGIAEKEAKLAEKKAREEKRREEAEANRIREQEEQRIKKQEKIEQSERRILEIPGEIEKLRSELLLITDKTGKAKINKQILALEKELRDLKTEIRKFTKGGTLSNKKKNIHKITKRHIKNRNKLTKRQTKYKIPRKTKKTYK